jgi:mRNA interferase MazF
VCVPITSQIKGYPFEVVLKGRGASGAAIADQVKSLDWRARDAARKGRASGGEMNEIRAKIGALMGLRPCSVMVCEIDPRISGALPSKGSL